MKLVTHNIGRGYKPEEIANLFLSLGADVYHLSEVDRGNIRTRNIDVPSILASQFPDFYSKFAEEFEEKHHWIRSVVPIGGPGGGVTGNQVLSRYEISHYKVIRLPDPSKLWSGRRLFTPNFLEPRNGSRIAQLYSITKEDNKISLCNTHLENRELINGFEARKQQLQPILDFKPDIIAGDMNNVGRIGWTIFGTKVNRETHQLREFMDTQGYYDPFENTDYTYERWGIRGKLDWIFIKKEIKTLYHEVVRTNLSDHHALSVTLDVIY